ncbi:complement C1q-like protein 4 isoform X2 [Pecten maximus]|nr:complement C1q-like protein 4 isoform X2 [Pecten maximus]
MERQETRLRQLERTVSDHVEDLKLKDIRIRHLERELQELKIASNPILGKVDKHLSNVSALYANPSSPRETSRNSNTSKQAPEGNSPKETPTKSIRVSPVDPSRPSAFSVSLSKNFVSHSGMIILFDDVLLDTNGNYNKGDGIYQVPSSGVYVFTWVMTGELTEWLSTELVVNGSSRGSTITNTNLGSAYDCSTGVILTSVSAGDHVFIRSVRGGTVRSVPHHSTSMFSGWRLS